LVWDKKQKLNKQGEEEGERNCKGGKRNEGGFFSACQEKERRTEGLGWKKGGETRELSKKGEKNSSNNQGGENVGQLLGTRREKLRQEGGAKKEKRRIIYSSLPPFLKNGNLGRRS